jgi:hypothetical protein
MSYEKSNKTKVEGDNNIIIQDVKDGTITINVNGDVQEIRNDLQDLKTLLENLKVETFQQGKNIYNIEHVNTANFGFITGKTGKKAFNEFLIKNLIQEIKPFNEVAEGFLDDLGDKPDWQDDELTDAKEIIISAFAGVLGIQLRKLISIGNEDGQEKQERYIQNSVLVANISIELACFVLISRLWENKEKCKNLSTNLKEQFKSFFDKKFERKLPSQFEFLHSLIETYIQNDIQIPIPELKQIYEAQNHKEKIQNACHNLQAIMDTKNYTLVECYDAEKELTTILSVMNFWAAYQMISIKEVNYDGVRNQPIKYLHNYTKVGWSLDEKWELENNPKEVNYIEKPVSTDSVLLFKENYKESINLSPFVIDINALTLEGDSKICFYYSRHFKNKKMLIYRFLENNDAEKIIFQDVLEENKNNLNKVMSDKEKRIQYKLDLMYLLFQEIRGSFLVDM